MSRTGPADRKRAQRKRDKVAGWVEVTIRVSQTHVGDLRAYAAALPPPEPPTDPRQLDLLKALDAELRSGVDSKI
jgi:hypothetical protein